MVTIECQQNLVVYVMTSDWRIRQQRSVALQFSAQHIVDFRFDIGFQGELDHDFGHRIFDSPLNQFLQLTYSQFRDGSLVHIVGEAAAVRLIDPAPFISDAFNCSNEKTNLLQPPKRFTDF